MRMKAEIFYSAAARRDLETIGRYIAEELASPKTAARTVERLMDAADGLEEWPERGAPLFRMAGVSSPYRFLVSGSYLLVYRTEARRVVIVRILYGRRDYARLFPFLTGPAQEG